MTVSFCVQHFAWDHGNGAGGRDSLQDRLEHIWSVALLCCEYILMNIFDGDAECRMCDFLASEELASSSSTK